MDGTVAVVTGAGQGIGAGIARRYAREGATVVVADIDAARGEEVAAGLADLGGKGLFVATDVTRKADVEEMVATAVERLGRIDVVVNNAIALSPNVGLEDKSDEMLELLLGVGLWPVWWSMHAAFPAMRRQGGGRIINLYSMDADMGAWTHADYNTVKGGVGALTRSAATEWARFNILVNAIAPIAATQNYEAMVEANPWVADEIAAMIPLGRIGLPEDDIGPVAVFLATNDSRYVTGATIPVDGGLHLPRVNTKPRDPAFFAADAPEVSS
ncbi:MAG: 3-oxoacyl-[acyl-carrier protein] reductase [Actinomycetota bacterium]|jgi:NAD(P)-dependent dehydrogenase (short-subunit alcohol dehydrogenase family)|nr:3-oxoacyl-[acyl-carrier protein] reductase [Actinomycetota bacterium]